MDFEKNADFIYLEGKAKRINIRTDREGDTLITNGKDLIAVLWDVEANAHPWGGVDLIRFLRRG